MLPLSVRVEAEALDQTWLANMRRGEAMVAEPALAFITMPASPRSMRAGPEMVSGAVQYQTWDLTDAVIEGRTDRALGVLKRMNAKDQPPQLLSYMLVRQFRQLMLAQALLRDGMSAPQIGTQLGLSNFPLRKIIEQATRFPADRLEAAYRRLLESDVAVKTGVLEADTALEMLIVALSELAKAPRATGRVPVSRS